ncbi:putative DDE superfamily endonuclease [Monocercomonoides exilis]|uniref:putative DDE superfamily endonuclease n=1 Tax=Monocercomonoides exilis TaxID=2049356 RepID=UPI0035597824|nr:putative DDE superfamily endonuclease [Monocercomonoides exilis]KAH7819327.1 putative DDE superfamily endonuclease [Monocercomonoides exilis]|eukprot:MONOS_13802.1-p1 / transcript=MONOS_13802.1 / gene=MONOS_13802 / organism=Monocercomonoides_exilis_PA203 / gene_product=unspecified product / transcript_product=unspecified product / location=Mono_scaffold00885:24070-24864(-) / protein_length=264 / sequence_SO=supercontig / SO=protein_coding / is_pseudo=false
MLSSSFYDTQNATIRLLHRIAADIRVPLTDLFLTFRPDRLEGMKEVGLVLDCTVIPTNRPGGRLEYGKKFYSGKHHIYCVKVEVGVNPRIGTACTISHVQTGSTHDFVLFKDHLPQFESQLGGAKILADSAYIGARPELGAIISKPVGTPELASKRVIVERFFGRLKTLFAVFRRPWPFEVERVAEYFTIACCLTNFHILKNPLTAVDSDANSRFIGYLMQSHEKKVEAKRIANERYRVNMKKRLNPEAPTPSSITTLFYSEDS